jgi:hypothetical protein
MKTDKSALYEDVSSTVSPGKIIFVTSFFAGFGLCFYFYVINFNNMSETDLLNSVLYWYVPLVFGLYGLTANRIHRTISGGHTNAIKHLFTGKDAVLISLTLFILVLSGILGVIFFFIPLSIFKPNDKKYALSVAATGSILWLVGLYFFFEVIWPSL